MSNAERQARHRLKVKRQQRAHGHEWFTGGEYIKFARAVLGKIDCDPASCAIANRTVRAATYFTKADDGLSQQWRGKVFLNPPFQLAGQFVGKLVSEIESGRVKAAILLVPDATDTSWYHQALNTCAAFCIPRGRVQFYHPEKSIGLGGGKGGHSFFYFGTKVKAFSKLFGTIGLVISTR
jgi:ParB family transcriptional regulator, chromosome partitioning protein